MTGSRRGLTSWPGRAAQLREQNAQLVRVNEELRELVGDQAARLAEANESLAVLQRMVFGGSRRRTALSLPGLAMVMIPLVTVRGAVRRREEEREAGPGGAGGAAGLLPPSEVEVIWDFPGGGTAARTAGSRSPCWGRTCPGSSWTAGHDHGAGTLPAPL